LRLIHAFPFLRLHAYFKNLRAIFPKRWRDNSGIKDRCRSFLDERIVPMEEIYNNVLISGHGALIRAMISVVVSLPDSYFWSGKEQGNCAVTIMECKNKEIKLIEEAIDTQSN